MSTVLLPGPFIVPELKPSTGGVDFLGLRQVNLAIREDCLPGINNRTGAIRPFSLLCWIYWKFHELAAKNRIERPTTAQLRSFKEKIETLFTWSHKLHDVRGLPGIEANPRQTSKGRVLLTFEAWGRTAANTSLMAAVNYGPATKTTNGLVFLEPVRGELYRTVGDGTVLAAALDECLQRLGANKLLDSLTDLTATEKEASRLFPAWAVGKTSAKEKAAFRRAFYDESAVGADDAIGKRSATLSLILTILQNSSKGGTENEIRKAMYYGRLSRTKPLALPSPLEAARWRWVTLQVRQAQRLALESLLSWVERRLVWNRLRDPQSLVDAALESRGQDSKALLGSQLLGSVVNALRSNRRDLASWLNTGYTESGYCLLALMAELEEEVQADDSSILPLALRILIICALYAEQLSKVQVAGPLLRLGGPERVSLSYLSQTLERCRELKVKDFLSLVIEDWILSQHFNVATRRYDGQTQRLRLTIEEEGLAPLVTKPWRPRITPDKLYSALSLMADCGMIRQSKDEIYHPA